MKKSIYGIAFVIFVLSGCNLNTAISRSNGTLTFNQSSLSITQNSSTELTVNVAGVSSAQGAVISFSSSNTAVAAIVQNQCVLSDAPGHASSCEIRVKGLTNGSAVITATSPGVVTASVTATVSNAPVLGSLSFTPLVESVVAGSEQRVTLSLDNSSGISNLEVSIQNSSPANAAISLTKCILSTEFRSCTIKLSGVAAGQTVLTASASGYASVNNTATVLSNGIIPGALVFDNSNQQIYINSYKIATVKLMGSSGVSSLPVTITTQNANATISSSACNLSSAKPLCYIIVSGQSVGSDIITASATNYASANQIASIISTPVPGTLYFAKSTASVVSGTTTTVDLVYSGGDGVSDLAVAVSANNSKISVSPSSCTMSNMHNMSICRIIVTGNQTGSATITASATGYPNATNTVTVTPSGNIIYGTLHFAPQSISLAVGNSGPLTLTLESSSNVSSLPVTITSSVPGTATAKPSCTLSTLNNSCSVNVTGVADGTAIISASATEVSNVAKAVANISGSAEPYFLFNPNPIVLSNQSLTAVAGTVTLVNAPIAAVGLNFSVSSNVIGYSPGAGSVSAATPSIGINVNNVTLNGPTGKYDFLVTPVDNTILPAQLPVYVAQPTPVARTITVINQCPFTVYAGISGGGFTASNPAVCPGGATQVGPGSAGSVTCNWTNPLPSNGYALANNQSTQFVIPANAPSSSGSIWSGGIMARIKDKVSNNWIIGNCSGLSVLDSHNATSESCVVGIGFDTPQTVAEFTFLAAAPDSYDVQLINGITIPTGMKPTGIDASTVNPYTNGEAGSIAPKNGILYNLKAASWVFDSTIPAGNLTESAYYNYVDGDGTISCTANGSASCASGKVCGYNFDALNTYSANATTHHASYALSCGHRLAYLTADAIWKANPDTTGTSNMAANFNFYGVVDNVAQTNAVPYPNSLGYQLHTFYECTGGLTNSGYQLATTYPVACGCFNWNTEGIATPTEQCYGTGVTNYTAATTGIGFNSAWINQVLPRIKWIKTGCPTCYSFQYDDPSSSFSGYTPASTSNPANAMNYTVTFCPGGKVNPDYPPSWQ